MSNESMDKNQNIEQELGITGAKLVESKNVLSAELRVNAINYLMMLMNSTFKDPACFLDENGQNADRAKATYFKVTIDYHKGKVTVEDNGQGLSDHQKLFSIAESGWDSDVMENENPFGTGFFSNIGPSKRIEIWSRDKHIVFNANKVIQTRDMKSSNDPDGGIFVEQVPEEEFFHGFKMTLHDFDFSLISPSDIEERVMLLGRYMHQLEIYMNGVLQERLDLTTGDGSAFLASVQDNELCKGWLSLSDSWNSASVNIFYKGRFVMKLDDCYYAKGDLHITDKALNLTAPDRKDVIKDSKLSAFNTFIKNILKKVAVEAVATGTQKDIDLHTGAIEWYVDKDEAAKLARFRIFLGSDKKDMGFIKKISHLKKDNPRLDSLSDVEAYLQKQEQQESDKEEKEIVREYDYAEEQAISDRLSGSRGSGGYSGGGGYSGRESKVQVINDKDVIEVSGEVVVNDNATPIFWIKLEELTAHEHKIRMIEYHELRLIIVRNKLEQTLLTKMQDSDKFNVLHIAELKENILIKATLSNRGQSVKEQRADMILDMISRMAGFGQNVFAIGDVMMATITSIPCIKRNYEVVEEDVVAVVNEEEGVIYVDRSVLNAKSLEENLNDNLTLNDYKFILFHLEAFIKQMETLRNSIERDLRPDFENLFERILQGLARN
jgi:hypothetical protein